MLADIQTNVEKYLIYLQNYEQIFQQNIKKTKNISIL